MVDVRWKALVATGAGPPGAMKRKVDHNDGPDF